MQNHPHRIALGVRLPYHRCMEKRITTLEVLVDQNTKSIDRLDRSVAELRSDVDRKFMWMIGIQLTGLAAMMAAIARLAKVF